MLKVKRRQQNQKFPSFQMFRFAAGGVGGAANKNDRKFLGFAPRELVERGRGAKVSRFVQNAFERSYIIPPEFDFRAFCPRIPPHEARKDEEKQGRRAGRGWPSAGSKSLAILSICFAHYE